MGGDTPKPAARQPEDEGLGDALKRLFRTTISGSEPYESLQTPSWGLRNLPHKEIYAQEEDLYAYDPQASLRAFQSDFERTFHSGPGFVTGQEFDTSQMRAAAAAARAKTAGSMRPVDIPLNLELAYDPASTERPVEELFYQSDIYRHLLRLLNPLLQGETNTQDVPFRPLGGD